MNLKDKVLLEGCPNVVGRSPEGFLTCFTR